MNELELECFEKILYYCNEIQEDLGEFGDSLDMFLKHESYQRSVCFSLFQIGEIANNLKKHSPQLLRELPQIPWHEVIAMRNVIGHGYESVVFEKVWNTITEDIPKLKSFCETLLLNVQPVEKF